MPKTKKEEIIFSIIMVLFMAYTMLVYNISLNIGLSYNTFVIALKSLPTVALTAWLLEHFIVGKLVKDKSFKLIDPRKYDDIVVILVISVLTVVFMCPLMSLIETIIHNYKDIKEIPILFVKAFVLNLPVALLAQLLYIGPLVRKIFSFIKR